MLPLEIGLSDHIDLALILLYLFWVFFFGLVLYLNREGMREGFPVVSESTGKPMGGGVVGLPAPKTFRLREGGELQAPHPEDYDAPVNATPTAPSEGSPLEPVGDPMLSAFGPGAYANRLDQPGLTYHGDLKMAPMRDLPDFSIAKEDRDPRGLPVMGADGSQAGVVSDVWIDREEQLIRYLEVELPPEEGAAAGRRVLAPMPFLLITGRRTRTGGWQRYVKCSAIMADQFADVPMQKEANQVTLLEEDMITAYYGGGILYATPRRRSPLL